MKPAIIAHRGASALAKHENSLEAFQIAIDIKADYVEFDIRKTKDGELIVFHDDTYMGHTISDLSYDELCKLTGKAGLIPPRLSEVLALCKDKIKLDIELKEGGYEDRVISMVTSSFDYGSFMMKSFLDQVVLRVKTLDANIKAGLLVGIKDLPFPGRFHEYFPMKRLKKCKADFISPHYRFATAPFLFRMSLKKKDVYIWTVNNSEQIQKFLKKNVTGIITDRPDIGLNMRNA